MNLKYSARALLLALLEEQEEEEDEEDLLLLSKLSEVGKKHSRYQKNYINSLSPAGIYIPVLVWEPYVVVACHSFPCDGSDGILIEKELIERCLLAHGVHHASWHLVRTK